MFRSQQMTYYQLVMPRESAWIIINELGYLNRIQLVDHNPEQPIISRPFANYIKRCDDLLNKLSQILKEAEKVGQLKNYRKGDSVQFVQQTIKHHHTQLDKIEDEIIIRVNKISENQRNYEQLLEQSMFSKEYRTILQIFQKFCGDQLLEKRSEFSKFDYFVGVINSREIQLFERLLFRITKGNAMIHFNIIQNEDISQPSRAVYIFMYPNSGPYMRNKLQRLCDSQSKSKFVIPTTQSEFNQKVQELNLKTTEIDHLLSLTYSQLCQQINELIISPGSISLFEQYRFFLLKEKELYNNLNKLKMQGHLFTGDLWVPQQDVSILENTLNNLKNTDIPGVQIVQKPFPINEKVPTLFKTNDFTKPYQLIVDTYGVPRYQEINPALFSCITFPFLFGVMFGDIGHGGFLFCFGIYLCIFRKSIPIFDEYRYLLLLMGFFAFYSGWIYNDYVGLTIDMGSCYSQNGIKLTKKLNDCEYNFGIDPAWYGTIAFGDSVKMKFSVIVAYFHMSLGIILSGLNYLYKNEKVAFFCKFIPQILFITCTFGYMDFLIVYKWLNVYTDATAPSIINTMIDMFLQLGQVTELAMFNIYTQEFIQTLLLIIALICVPWMWLPETLYKMYELNHKHSNIDYKQLEDDHSIELQNVELQHSRRLSQNMNIDEENTHNVSPTTSQIGFLDHQPQEFNQSASDIFVQETIETIEFVLGAISNTASYLRLWALSLAHSQLAEVFFDLILAGPIENSFYIKPIIYFPIWAMISFGVLMCMDSLECFLHSLRLHWYDFYFKKNIYRVEFQNKFYKGDGVKFEAFSFIQKLSDI